MLLDVNNSAPMALLNHHSASKQPWGEQKSSGQPAAKLWNGFDNMFLPTENWAIGIFYIPYAMFLTNVKKTFALTRQSNMQDCIGDTEQKRTKTIPSSQEQKTCDPQLSSFGNKVCDKAEQRSKTKFKHSCWTRIHLKVYYIYNH